MLVDREAMNFCIVTAQRTENLSNFESQLVPEKIKQTLASGEYELNVCRNEQHITVELSRNQQETDFCIAVTRKACASTMEIAFAIMEVLWYNSKEFWLV